MAAYEFGAGAPSDDKDDPLKPKKKADARPAAPLNSVPAEPLGRSAIEQLFAQKGDAKGAGKNPLAAPKKPAPAEKPAEEEMPAEVSAPADAAELGPADLAEAEAIATLSPAEQAEAVAKLAEGRAEELETQTAHAPPTPADAAAQNFQKEVAAAAAQQGIDPHAAIDAAYTKVTGEAPPPLPDQAVDAVEPGPDGAEPAEQAGTKVPDADGAMHYEDVPGTPDTNGSVPPIPAGAGNGVLLNGVRPAVWNFGGGPGRPAGPGAGGPAMPAPGNNMNAAPLPGALGGNVLAAPVVVRQPEARGVGLATVAVVGVVAYLLGRRRGRIRTERQLLPIQRKLERQVNTLQQQLIARENDVRRVTENRLAQDTLMNTTQHAAAAAEVAAAAAAASAAVAEQAATAPRPAERPAAQSGRTEQSSATPSSPMERAPISQAAERLSLPQALAVSETIAVGTTDVRKVYEAGLIDEMGLRHVIDAHFRGEDVRPVLREELQRREREYEQDPQLRHRPPVAPSPAAATTAATQPAAPEPPLMGDFAPAVPPLPVIPPAALPVADPEHGNTPRSLVIMNVVALVVLALLLSVAGFIWFLHH